MGTANGHMKILLIHQNFPGQFKHLAPALVRQGHDVRAFSMNKNAPAQWNGVKVYPYQPGRGSSAEIHPWVADFETKVIRAEAAFHHARKLRDEGFEPDVILAHHGWGESLFLKEVWPKARLGIYCEFFYIEEGGDVGFDPEFPGSSDSDICRLRMKNLNNLLHFEIADAAISPTHWQASTFPAHFRSRITVVHDGIDTDAITPNPKIRIQLNQNVTLSRDDEVITFVNRNLEPMRGYHIFMRALPELLRRRPKARVLIVGGDKVSYGAKPSDDRSWKQTYIDEVRHQMPPGAWERVHFLGNIDYGKFVAMLQLSRVHVYLTCPFVLSWSLIEAMSAGCAIVASDTTPLHEAIRDGETGRLVNFFDVPAWVDQIDALLGQAAERERLGRNAREFARTHYDLQRVCLPQQLAWVQSLGEMASVKGPAPAR